MTWFLIGLGGLLVALATTIIICACRLASAYDAKLDEVRAYREVRDE